MIKTYSEDALKFLKSLSDASVSCFITDPPYWTLNKWRAIGTTTRLGGHKDKNKRKKDSWFETIDTELLDMFYLMEMI